VSNPVSTPDGGWGAFYAAGADLSGFFSSLHYHEPLIRELLAGPHATALEAGSGPGVMSAFLAMAGVRAIAVDNDPEVLKVARESAARWPVQPEFVEADIFHLDQLDRTVDVVFSQGVLEHFGDDEIHEIVRQSLAIAPRLVFSVPSKFYGVQDFGNERLMLASDWERILSGLGRVTTKPYFNARRRTTRGLSRPLMVLGIVERG
jgi:SAM-dependent methyltransferase